MANFNAWGGGEGQPDAIAEIISYKSVSITPKRDGSVVAAQTIRLETLSSQRQVLDTTGQTHICDALALGYKGHPTIPDTDLRAGDRFAYDGVSFEVIVVLPGHTDNLQAWLQMRS